MRDLVIQEKFEILDQEVVTLIIEPSLMSIPSIILITLNSIFYKFPYKITIIRVQ